jgi:hypothetical protein
VPWSILDGPATIQHPRDGDWDIGWAWLIARDDDRRHVVVYVAGGRLNVEELADESRQAIQTSGRSAVSEVLGEDEPPARLVVTSDGTRRE